MKITTSGFDSDGIREMMKKSANEHFAQATADRAIEQGVSSAEEALAIKFDLKKNDEESDIIDLEWIERRAREILVERLS